MKISRIFTLLRKELTTGTQNVIFVMAVVVPIVITLVVSLLFGTLFLGQPRLGIADEGSSEISRKARELRGITLKTYPSDSELKDAVLEGIVDVGIIVPAEFDEMFKAGEQAPLTIYVFGESLLRDRAVLATSFASLIRDLSGEESPVVITTTALGDTEAIPWEVRLLPLIVIMTILLGGTMVPATSLVEEKQRRTLTALTVTPSTFNEVLFAKGVLGVVVSVIMAVVILLLNRATGDNFGLLIFVLTLGGIMSAVLGVFLGTLVKDINTLFAMIKGLGIVLYAPAFVYLFPAIPEWVGRIFPTYYMLQPVLEIAQEGAGWAEVAPEVAILIVLTILLALLVGLITRRIDQFAA